MATHRFNKTALTPDHAFQTLIQVLEAADTLFDRRRPVTPDTLFRYLCPQPSAPHPTLAQIQNALSQIQCWRAQILTRDLLQHRRQITTLRRQLSAEARVLAENQAYLERLLHDTDAILQNNLRGCQVSPLEPTAGISVTALSRYEGSVRCAG